MGFRKKDQVRRPCARRAFEAKGSEGAMAVQDAVAPRPVLRRAPPFYRQREGIGDATRHRWHARSAVPGRWPFRPRLRRSRPVFREPKATCPTPTVVGIPGGADIRCEFDARSSGIHRSPAG